MRGCVLGYRPTAIGPCGLSIPIFTAALRGNFDATRGVFVLSANQEVGERALVDVPARTKSTTVDFAVPNEVRHIITNDAVICGKLTCSDMTHARNKYFICIL